MPDWLIGCPSMHSLPFTATPTTTPCHLPVKCARWKLVQVAFTKIKANTPHKRNANEPLFLFASLLFWVMGGGKTRGNVSQFIALSFRLFSRVFNDFITLIFHCTFHVFSLSICPLFVEPKRVDHTHGPTVDRQGEEKGEMDGRSQINEI